MHELREFSVHGEQEACEFLRTDAGFCHEILCKKLLNLVQWKGKLLCKRRCVYDELVVGKGAERVHEIEVFAQG